MDPVVWTVTAAMFVATICAVYFLAGIGASEPELQARLAVLERDSTLEHVGARPLAAVTEAARTKGQRVMSLCVPQSEGLRHQLRSRLIQAGLKDARWLTAFYVSRLVMLVAPPLGALAVAELTGRLDVNRAVFWGCLAGVAGYLVPGFWLDRQVAQRHRILRRSLPDFLDLLLVCLRGGLSVQGALVRVTEELQIAHPVLAEETSHVVRDIELGATLDGAFQRFAERSGEEGVRTLSSFIRESQRFGVELVEALRNHAEMMRVQREHEAEAMAQKAAVKILIPTLLLIFPAVFIVLAGPAVIKIQQAFSH